MTDVKLPRTRSKAEQPEELNNPKTISREKALKSALSARGPPLNLKATGQQRLYAKGFHPRGTSGQSQGPARTPAGKRQRQGAGCRDGQGTSPLWVPHPRAPSPSSWGSCKQTNTLTPTASHTDARKPGGPAPRGDFASPSLSFPSCPDLSGCISQTRGLNVKRAARCRSGRNAEGSARECG